MNGYGNVIKRSMISTPETQLRIDFDNRDRFIDITTDNLHIPYHATEILLGHTFKHITKGIFKASPGFYADKNMMNQLHNKYPEVVFCVATDKGNVSYVEEGRIVFAFWHGTDERYCGDKDYVLKTYIEDRTDPRFFEGEEDLQGITSDIFSPGERREGTKVTRNTNALRPYDDGTIINGEKAFINFYGNIGMLVEPGIYSFITESDPYLQIYRGVEMQFGEFKSDRHVAWIGFSYIDTRANVVSYMAVDTNYFARLKELADSMDRLNYYENSIKSDSLESSSYETNIHRALSDEETEEIKERIRYTVPVEDGAIELVQGMGFYKIELWFSRPFLETVHEKEYDIAYRKDDDLVLITIDPFSEEVFEERHKLAMIDGLYVKQSRKLRNGSIRRYYHCVIHDDTKYRQLLTDEGYELYMAEQSCLSR